MKRTEQPCSAGFPACEFTELSSSVSDRALRNWGLESPLPRSATHHPGGMADNSPTFQRWEHDRQWVRVPKGRLNYAPGQPSLRDLLPNGRQFPTLKRWAIIASPSG